jgi:murein L,D-transpeptidase YcbB/YkuD
MRLALHVACLLLTSALMAGGAAATTPDIGGQGDKITSPSDQAAPIALPGSPAADVAPSPESAKPFATVPAASDGAATPTIAPLPTSDAAPTAATADVAPPAAASASATPSPTETSATPPPAVPSADEELSAKLRDLLATVPSALKGRDRSERQALATFYEARGWQPIWATASAGLNAKGTALLAELKDADAWGLKAADYDVAGLGDAADRDAATAETRAAAEIQLATAALKYARHARGGRTEPLQLSRNLDRKLSLVEPSVVLDGLATGDDPAGYLRGLHPQHPQFELLRKAYLDALASTKEAASLPKIPDGPKVAPGARHADIALIRKRLSVPAKADSVEDGETLFDPELVKAVAAFQAANGIKPANGTLTPATRHAFNAALENTNARRLLVNMEEWRWMPEDLGSLHIWVSIPDFTFNVVKDGEVIHSERVVVGKPDTQTPIFSDQMEFVIFHPEWGVPDSIKVKEILPSLRAGSNILARQNLRVMYGGRVIDASSVDWSVTDVRQFSFVQGSGTGNVLGVVKFRFPNHHDVYMHDTPTKGLFAQTVRAYSHGCIRVQNPVKLAELLLGEDKGMSPERVRALASPSGLKNNQITLSRKIPVHLTYFTAFVDKDGRVQYRRDIYGHEQRIAMGLEGKAHLIPQPKPEAVAERAPVGSFKEVKSGPVDRAWMRDVFKF